MQLDPPTRDLLQSASQPHRTGDRNSVRHRRRNPPPAPRRTGQPRRVQAGGHPGPTCAGTNPGRSAADMVAFANTEEAPSFITVDDPETPVGIPRESLDLVERWVADIGSDHCDPPIQPVLRRAIVPGSRGELTILLAKVRRLDAGIALSRMWAGRGDAEDGAYDIEMVDEAIVNALAHWVGPVRLEDQSAPVRRSAGALQPSQAAQPNHDRADAVPHVHPQPASGRIPLEGARQATGRLSPESRGEGSGGSSTAGRRTRGGGAVLSPIPRGTRR